MSDETKTGEIKTEEIKTDVKVQNLTAKRLTIHGNAGRILILSPFEKEKALSIAEQEFFPRLDGLKRRNLISTWAEEKAADLESQIKMLFWGNVMGTGVVAYVAYQVMTESGKVAANPDAVWWLKRAVPVSLVLVMLIGSSVLYVLRKREQKKAFLRNIARWILQAFSLLTIVTIGMVLPTLAFYQFGGGREVLGGPNSLVKLGRTLQLVFIFSASLLPALLYYLFDRQQLGTLRQRFEQQIFRLDPNIESLCDVRAKYGRQIDEIYGHETVSGEGRLTRGTRWPILVATLVITIGWMLTLLPAGPIEISSPNQLIDFFMPQKSVVTFGFLGAYFFVLNMVLHRYVRADLKPKAYSSITVRILIVIILAWVIGLPFSSANSYELALVFMVGVFPESGLTLIRESIRNQKGFGKLARVFGKRKEKYPLTDLEELDVYDRARLLDEGVTNIESFAHHDLIDLMLETRIPVPRLVDWLDQAVLYLHMAPENDEEDDNDNPQEQPGKSEPKAAEVVSRTEPAENQPRVADPKPQPPPIRVWLRSNSVRTATDFVSAYNSKQKTLRRKAEAEGRTAELDVLLQTLEDDEWLDYIDHWRKSSRVEDLPLDASSGGPQPTRVNVRIKSLDGHQAAYEADFQIDQANPDSMVAAHELEKIGIKPLGKTAYRLGDGSVSEYPFALAEISFMGEITVGRVVFGPEEIRPVLGVTALQSVGVCVNPISPTLRQMPGSASN